MKTDPGVELYLLFTKEENKTPEDHLTTQDHVAHGGRTGTTYHALFSAPCMFYLSLLLVLSENFYLSLLGV